MSGVEVDNGGIGTELARLRFLDVRHPESVLSGISTKEDGFLDPIVFDRDLCRENPSVSGGQAAKKKQIVLTLRIFWLYLTGGHSIIVQGAFKSILVELLLVEAPCFIRIVGESHARGSSVAFDEDACRTRRRHIILPEARILGINKVVE